MDQLRFVLYQVHGLQNMLNAPRFADHEVESLNMMLDAIKDFSDREAYPYFREMDEDPARFEDGKIYIHPANENIIKRSAELGLIGSNFDYEEGGVQLPGSVFTAAYMILEAANNNVTGYPGLTTGAAELLFFADDELKNRFLPKMLEGRWGGTMCLTEPQAGSSLSDVTTAATPTDDGHYLIQGQKIFISGGDHQYNENFVHLVLARIDGAPTGTKGISLFVVPKFREENGELEFNDVNTAGDFQKLGQRGYCTTHLVFGEAGDCRGWLVGEPHAGLSYMFRLMNGARIAVGRGAAAMASAAYYASLQYASERAQGRRVSNEGVKDINAEPVLINQHPDVRRMLLFQKAVVEGSISLVLQAAVYSDLVLVSEGDDKKRYNMLLEILTPIVKTYPAELGKEAVDNGLQVLGGYGFCSEYILQQYYRDIRITSIYEGTTGIQSMDLLGRKITMKSGQALQFLFEEIQGDLSLAANFEELRPYVEKLGEKIQLGTKVLQHLGAYAKSGQYERYLSDATVFFFFFAHIVVSWQWLKMATEAKKSLLNGDGEFSNEFYESKIHTMKFYFKYLLPRTSSYAETLFNEEVLTIPDEEKEIHMA
jgi:butyryl-CoA dehydrogenase